MDRLIALLILKLVDRHPLYWILCLDLHPHRPPDHKINVIMLLMKLRRMKIPMTEVKEISSLTMTSGILHCWPLVGRIQDTRVASMGADANGNVHEMVLIENVGVVNIPNQVGCLWIIEMGPVVTVLTNGMVKVLVNDMAGVIEIPEVAAVVRTRKAVPTTRSMGEPIILVGT